LTAESSDAYHDCRELRSAHGTERIMDPLSLPDLDLELERRIRELARREGLSVSDAAVALLRRGAESLERGQPAGPIGDALDRFVGSWPVIEETRLLESIAACEEVDEALWK
jgi:hypothetical protein